jgi:dihydroxy-acid dehydratase
VRTGDKVKLSVKERRLDLLVADADLAERRAEWEKHHVALPERGYDKLFRQSVLQAPEGCDFDFLRPGAR